MALYGVLNTRPYGGLSAPLKRDVGKNSEVFNIGDLVNLTSGFAEVVDGTTDPINGISKEKKTMASDNQTVAQAKLEYSPIENLEFEMEADGTLTQAMVGHYFTVAGATGVQQVTVSTDSATVGQVQLVALDPRGEGSTLLGLWRVALPQNATFEPET